MSVFRYWRHLHLPLWCLNVQCWNLSSSFLFSGIDDIFIYHSDRLTFHQAQAACEANGMILSMPDNQAKQERLTSYLETQTRTSNQVWIGLTDILEEANFLWLDGREASWSFWGANKPNNGGFFGEHCVTLVSSSSFEWNDRPCSDTLSYVCEKIIPGMYKVCTISWPKS